MAGDLWRDGRYALRMFQRAAGFAGAVILTLALGVGSATAIFSVVNGVLLRPLPYPEPDRLVYVTGNTWGPFTNNHEYVAWQRGAHSLREIAAYIDGQDNLTGLGESERVNCIRVTASLLPLLGAKPILGRVFTPADDQPPNGGQAALISEALWSRSFRRDPAVLGRALTLAGKAYTIVGVLPFGFRVPDRYHFARDVWLPLGLGDRGYLLVRTIGRLNAGVAPQAARAELDTLMQPAVRSFLRPGYQRHAVLTTWQDEIGSSVRRSLWVFLGAVGLLLLIACANVANLLLARAATREREMLVRRALGASRRRIVRQLLTESLILALLGGLAGLLLASWFTDLILAFLAPNLPDLDPIGIDLRVLGFTFVVATLSGIVFGLAPALQASRSRLSQPLKQGAGGRHRVRHALVAVEVALAVVLLAAASLLARSYVDVLQLDPGFKTDHTLTLALSLSPDRYSKPADQSRFYEHVLERLGGLHGVASAAVSTSVSMSGSASSSVWATIDGQADKEISTAYSTVSPQFFRLMGIGLVSGRLLTDADRYGAPGVILVNESFVRRYCPDASQCLGKRVQTHLGWTTVVGVVRDVRGYDVQRTVAPEIYDSYLQDGSNYMTVLVRTSGEPAAMAGAVRAEIRRIDRDQPPYRIMTLEDQLSEFLERRRINMLLLALFSGLALALASIGIYGVVSYSVGARTQEIGVRMALGAQPADVKQLVVGRCMLMVLAGLACGTAAAVALARTVTSVLADATGPDPLVLAGVACGLMLVGFVAAYLPARRATRVDPVVALGCE